ncbi:MAG: hypothetical protein NW201_11655 [Gemmatimonadales bacterium]|nr:hypothetical protein [Gemmatimonadales bacterium]
MSDAPTPPRVVRGACHACFAFEVGLSVDLAQAERRLAAEERRLVARAPRLRAQVAVQAGRVRLPVDPAGFTVAGIAASAVEVLLWEFGAASVNVAFPLEGPLEAAVPLSAALVEAGPLAEAARQRLEDVVARLGDAVQKPAVAGPVEDYLVLHVEALDPPCDPARFLLEHGELAARLLRSEPGHLSADEIADALASRLSFGPADLALVDWNAALVLDPDGDDARQVLEFANVQLQQLRFLDVQLDQALERAWDALTRPRGWSLLPSVDAGVAQVARLQAEQAWLFERITNALKLVGDQYLGRLHRLVAARLHMAEWDASIARKLETLDGIYQKLADRAAQRRAEVLEWIIIVLIAAEMVMSVVRRG